MTERERDKVVQSLEGLSQEDRTLAIAVAVVRYEVNLTLVQEHIARIYGDMVDEEITRDPNGKE